MTTTHTTPSTITDTPEDRALKAKHAAMWASGSYRTVVDDVVAPLGGILVETVDVQRGQRVLDVAAGTGTSAIPAARRGRRGDGHGPDARAARGRPDCGRR